MGFYALTALINGCVAAVLGFFVYFKNRERIINKTFGAFCFFVAVWSFAYFFWQISTTQETALFWSRALMAGAIFITICYFHFILELLNKAREKKRILVIGYLLFFFFFLVNFTPFFVAGVSQKLTFQFWPDAGILYLPFLLIWFFYAFYAVYLLLQAHSVFTGVAKNQIKYILIGTIVGYLGGATNYPLWFDVPVAPIGNWTAAFYLAVVAYAIVKYRLLDIRLVLSKGAVYIFSFVSVIAFAFFTFFLNNKLAEPLPVNLVAALIIITSVLIFQPIFKFFEGLASRYFYYTFYSYQRVLTGLSKELTRHLDLEQLSFLIITTLMDTMKLDRTVVLMREQGNGAYRIQKNIGFKEENGISLVKDNFLTVWLEKTQKPLVYEELSLIIRDSTDKEEKEKMEKLKENMKRIEAVLCLPLLIENKIIGMIVLGNKISGDSYSEQDINLLTNLANQASIAFQNASLYSEVKNFSKTLEIEVEKATKELKEAYEELKKLDKAKSEFISMASHQLRTPLSAIKGYISMMLEGFYGQSSAKTKEKLQKVFQSNERLIKIVNDLLNISKIELGKMELTTSLVRIEELIESCYEEMKPFARDKKLKFLLKKPQGPLPQINCDLSKVRQIVLNLIDNAIKYTQKGKIELGVEEIDGKIMIFIADTGEGMTEEETKQVFEGFTRGAAGINYWVEGSGLGLYIAKKYLELHGGRIWAESGSKGKGSIFFVELPKG